MREAPLISVVVPAWNAAAVVGEALRSIQCQDYPHFEAVVVDDGSTDETAALVMRFVQRDARFRLLRQAHAGVSAARNHGIAATHGEWIAFVDADDIWLPDKLSQQVNCLRRCPCADLLFSNYFLWDGRDDLGLRYSGWKPISGSIFAWRLIRYNLVGTSTVMVRRELVNRVGGFDTDLDPAEDWDMWLRMAEAGCRFHGLRQPLARYRVWPNNTSRQTLRMAQASVRVLQTRLTHCRAGAWRRTYRRSLAIARGNLELAAVRPLLEVRPESLTSAAGRAWRSYPWRLKWLAWSVAGRCPDFLGGNLLKQHIHRQIRLRW